MRKYHRVLAGIVAQSTGVPVEDIVPLFGSPPQAALGDISLPCFAFAKRLRKAPPAIAAELAALSFDEPWIREVGSAGPYVNFHLDRAAFAADVLVEVVAAGAQFGTSRLGEGRCVVIDFSSPNIAKHLAVHHLRSTMLGNAIGNLHRALGYKVVGINHLGDWGTSFGKLLCAWEHFGGALAEGSLAGLDDPISVLNDMYVRFNREAETHPELEVEARDWFRRLETGDPVARDRWTQIRAASLHRFDGLYERLGVRFEEVIGESFFEDRMQPILDELEHKGLLQESDHARVVFLEEWDMPPMLLTKQDGATLYSTRDLAAAEFRWQKWHFESCMYVVDAGQSLHFRQLFQVLRLLGREYADRLEHLEFGILRLPVDGRWARGKTRKGQVVLLEDVLDRARDLAREQILAKNPELENIDEVAEAIGIASVVLSDMKAKRKKDVNFDLEQITSFEGETGAYLQYTHARFCGIERKYTGDLTATADYRRLTTPEELALLMEITRYPAMVERAAAEREPSIISQYLLGLGSLFNTYYEAHKINVPEANLARTRVALVQALRTVLANGLTILGIRPLERM